MDTQGCLYIPYKMPSWKAPQNSAASSIRYMQPQGLPLPPPGLSEPTLRSHHLPPLGSPHKAPYGSAADWNHLWKAWSLALALLALQYPGTLVLQTQMEEAAFTPYSFGLGDTLVGAQGSLLGNSRVWMSGTSDSSEPGQRLKPCPFSDQFPLLRPVPGKSQVPSWAEERESVPESRTMHLIALHQAFHEQV